MRERKNAYRILVVNTKKTNALGRATLKCTISVIQQDTQYVMINFIHNIQYLDTFRASIVHLQERSYAVRCNLVCLDTSCCYEGEGRTASSYFTLITYRDIPNCNIQHKNAPEDGLLKSETC